MKRIRSGQGATDIGIEQQTVTDNEPNAPDQHDLPPQPPAEDQDQQSKNAACLAARNGNGFTIFASDLAYDVQLRVLYREGVTPEEVLSALATAWVRACEEVEARLGEWEEGK